MLFQAARTTALTPFGVCNAIMEVWLLQSYRNASRPRSVAHLNEAAFKGGSPKLGESQGLGESLRLSLVLGESSKLSPKTGESFRGESFNMKEL